MARIRLLHWKAAEAAPRIEVLKQAGYEVQYAERPSPASIRAGAPEAVVIDLSRLPSQGCGFGCDLRATKASRHIPLIFAGGDPEKVANVRKKLPDATYTDWQNVVAAIKKAMSRPLANPVVPKTMMGNYGHRTVAQKLGIESGVVVNVIDPPRNYTSLLGPLPDDVQFEEDEGHRGSVTLWFVHDAVSYQSGIRKRRALARNSKLWIVWPKGESGKRVGLTPQLIRLNALDAGLVDYKICAVSDVWSAMLFAAGKGA